MLSVVSSEMMISYLTITAILCQTFCTAFSEKSSEVPHPLIGFGVQRLRNQVCNVSIFIHFLMFSCLPLKGRKLKNFVNSERLEISTTCENVEQYWFADARIDNFAPIESQGRSEN